MVLFLRRRRIRTYFMIQTALISNDLADKCEQRTKRVAIDDSRQSHPAWGGSRPRSFRIHSRRIKCTSKFEPKQISPHLGNPINTAIFIFSSSAMNVMLSKPNGVSKSLARTPEARCLDSLAGVEHVHRKDRRLASQQISPITSE